MSNPPLCRWCGGPIAKQSRAVWIEPADYAEQYRRPDSATWRTIYSDDRPPTMADCQRLSNWKVLSVRRGRDGRINRFHEWDGESYVDPYFCNGDHAKRFGYACARSGKAMKAYNDAMTARQGVEL